jgi:CheY-like chemotaxis protein
MGLLEEQGLDVDVAETGEQAVRMAKATAYDLILMDVQMPDVDGLEATRQLRENALTRATPIIAMTSGKDESDEARCLEAGMNDCLGKPLDPLLLAGILTAWIPPLHRMSSPVNVAAAGPALASKVPQRARLPEILGVDAAQGVAFFAGNADAYASGLRMFVGLKDALPDAAGAYLDDPTPEHRHRLHREAHSIGGACAAIGAQEVATQASALSKLLQGDAPDAAMVGDVNALVEAVKELVDHIESALQRWP